MPAGSFTIECDEFEAPKAAARASKLCAVQQLLLKMMSSTMHGLQANGGVHSPMALNIGGLLEAKRTASCYSTTRVDGNMTERYVYRVH